MENSALKEEMFSQDEYIKNIEKSMVLWTKVIEKSVEISNTKQHNYEPLSQRLTQAFSEFQQSLIQQKPEQLAEIGMEWWRESLSIGQRQVERFMELSKETDENIENDRRFRHELWSSNAYYQALKENYKLTAKIIDDMLTQANDNLDERDAHLISFYGKQWRDALSPGNYPWSNPEVLKEAMETNGESLVRGLENLLHDLEQGRITMTQREMFTLGENIASTPGKVVYENRLFQLIQYEAQTDKVQKTPLLFIPAWINKYYILDLQEKNSMVNWMTQQGFTVFIVSWVNPDAGHQDIDFTSYLKEGAHEAVQQALKLTGEKKLHICGYCLGGTLVSCYLAWCKAKKLDDMIASATYLTTVVDFNKAGDLKLFVDEAQLKIVEKSLNLRGYLEGNEMATVFNALRPRDLIWSFVINNYLLGRKPLSFDLLYWNDDVTRMPAKMHLFYLREMYLNNHLYKGDLTLDKTNIKLDSITTPSYMLATTEDHIAPWQAAYEGTQLYNGPKRFVLSGSGHVAGVINPPAKEKYGWSTAATFPKDPQKWLEDSEKHKGSWWVDWKDWLLSIENKTISARKIKQAIEDAPGRYVQVRA